MLIKQHTLVLFFSLFTLVNCTRKNSSESTQSKVLIDGSSTVFPITEAIAEEYQKVQPEVQVTVGVSGTGGGFKKFVVGEIDVADASRPIKREEVEKAKANGINYLEIPIAFDGITMVVNKENNWVDKLTLAELKKIWSRDSKVKTWKDVRASWPDREIRLYGPGTDSGTFDYFTETVNGEAKNSRSDYTMSEDDNVIVKGISGDKDSLGYFGFSYYEANKSLIKSVAIEHDKKLSVASFESINDGSYKPLSRPVFIYVSLKSLKEKAPVQKFVRFYLEQAPKILHDVGFVPLPQQKYQQTLSLPELNSP
jgi:phosphate transport system substrate-binding protein